ncbi:MAG TPA: DEAD/DEAH box helicase, partial [Chloroflexota bacterium]|nr:DEAD/DEAH box helicase [Chloroflexota bacterium]
MAVAPPPFAIGSLVRARGRDWIVLPSDDPEVLMLRPLGGTDDDARGIYWPLERAEIVSATLGPPDPAHTGNAVSAELLRNAARLGFRSAAGPFRSMARIAVEPRPYQLVPLLLALRLEPVRLLISDDVGIGKTIEAAMIARELLDRGEIRRVCVLCPPHLCEQWRDELTAKFHLPAVEVRPGTASALERDLPLSRSIFEEYPVTVVSIDYIKSERRRASFLQTCPECVIVDEAHTMASGTATAGQQQRHEVLRQLARDSQRHLILVTATPHSGDATAFASLIGLLAPDIEDAVARSAFEAGSAARETLARHFIQRRRADILQYLSATTDFPARESIRGSGKSSEVPYHLTSELKELIDGTLK